MNRIAISITMILPPLFLLSLVVAQPVSAAPPNRAAAVTVPLGPAAIARPDGIRSYASEVVFGECTGSACSAPRPGNGLADVPDPLRLAPVIRNVAPHVLRVHVAPAALRVNGVPDALDAELALDALDVNVALDSPHVDVALDALHVDVTPNMLRVVSAWTPFSGEPAASLPTDIARGEGTGSARFLPRIVDDLLARLLDLVHRVPLPLPR
ncbi:hypothetical protein ACQP1G_11565 [Nocardia sp. CA-107356]|uniref:hypothetical protein n=1 Tax=Nocardia sp. CA-107356 TaxID=3239972 RepID=UPI003D8EA87B